MDSHVLEEQLVDSEAEQGEGLRRSKSNTPVKKKRARGELSKDEKKQGPKTFQNKWLEMEEFKSWLRPVPGNNFKAMCNPCDVNFWAGKSDTEKHAKGQKHIAKVKSIKNVRPINAVFSAPTKEQKLEIEVKKAEISLAAFFAEHNIAIMVADHLVQLIKKIFHDSEIAKKLTLDRTKCTAVVNNVLAKTEKEEIVEDLKTVPFSVLVDESTDVAGCKNMCLLTKFVSPKTGRVCTPLLEMIQLDSKDCSAEALYGKLKKSLCEYFNQMNALFQSQRVLVHRLQAESRQLMVKVCQNYMRDNVLDSAHKIDVKNPHFQLPLEKIYVGPGTTAALDQVPVPNDPALNQQQRVCALTRKK